MALEVGETLGRYQLEQLVGQGGMAVVYRAVDSVLGRTVAVKVIRPAYTEDPHFLERFLQEARVVASLDHPNILPLYDFGEEKGRPYLVLPYLPGGSLADRLGGRPQPLPHVAAWLLQLAGALDAAHARGVMHRDVKPGNVLITRDGRLVLGDFGIARLAEATTRLTATGTVVGTPVYMAPELARGADASPASDRYALAVMVYEMVAGLPPFVGSNPLSVLHQQVHEPVPALAGRLAGLPSEIDSFLGRALAKSPAARHPSARAMADELVQLLTPEQRAEISTVVWTGGSDALASSEAPTFVPSGATMRLPGPTAPTVPRPSTSAVTAAAPRARPVPPALWGVLAVVAIAGLVLFLVRDRLTGGPGQGAIVSPSPATGAPSAPIPGSPSPVPGPSTAPTARQASSPATPPEPAASAVGGRPEAQPPPAAEATPPAAEAAQPAAPAPVRGALRALLRPAGRTSIASFEQGLADSVAFANSPQRASVRVFRQWAQGGLAYARGDAAAARDVAVRLPALAAAAEVAPWGVGWPLLAFPRDRPWYLAALYGDPRSELEGLLQRELGGGGDAYTRLASAYLAHLDGSHEGAVSLVEEAGLDPLRDTVPGEARALVAQLLVAESVELRNGAEARRWMPAALGQGSAPLAFPFSLEMVALVNERLGPDPAQRTKNMACELGVRPLCVAPLQRGLAQPAERSQGKPDRFGGRRRLGPGARGGAQPAPTSPGPGGGGGAPPAAESSGPRE